jgi:7-cyano-7-deazaguanine reductase
VTDDPHAHRFLGSDVERPQFEALSTQGSGRYIGLEVFENPGVIYASYSSDEVMAKCPITGQPDWYTCEVALRGTEKLIESKSLKLFFQNIIEASYTRNFGIFCESLAVHIRTEIAQALEAEEEQVQVTLLQKSRGGISIKAIA